MFFKLVSGAVKGVSDINFAFSGSFRNFIGAFKKTIARNENFPFFLRNRSKEGVYFADEFRFLDFFFRVFAAGNKFGNFVKNSKSFVSAALSGVFPAEIIKGDVP